MTKLLDCTLRDGGLCLEDMTNYDANTPRFSFEQREKISCLLNESDVKESMKRGTGFACKLRSVVDFDKKERCFVVTEIADLGLCAGRGGGSTKE